MDVATPACTTGRRAGQSVMMLFTLPGATSVVAAPASLSTRECWLLTPSTRSAFDLVVMTETGRVDLAALDAAVTEETAAVFGTKSQTSSARLKTFRRLRGCRMQGRAALVRCRGFRLEWLSSPSRRYVSMERQSFGVALSMGPFCGVNCGQGEYLLQMAWELVARLSIRLDIALC